MNIVKIEEWDAYPFFRKVASWAALILPVLWPHSLLLTPLLLSTMCLGSLSSTECRLLCLDSYLGCGIVPPSQQCLHGHHEVMSPPSQFCPQNSLIGCMLPPVWLAQADSISLAHFPSLPILGPGSLLATLVLPALCIHFDPLIQLPEILNVGQYSDSHIGFQ